jgi:hypothetical protein
MDMGSETMISIVLAQSPFDQARGSSMVLLQSSHDVVSKLQRGAITPAMLSYPFPSSHYAV